MTVAILDFGAIAEALGVLERSGLLPPRILTRPCSMRVPPIRFLSFDRAEKVFHLSYDDGVVASVGVHELDVSGDGEVVYWSLDEERAGVDLTLSDGTVSSFSGDFVLYLRDTEYRRQIDARRSEEAGRHLAERIAAKVRTLREERGWSQAELARRCGIAAPNLHRLEAAAHVPSTATLMRVAGARSLKAGRWSLGRYS